MGSDEAKEHREKVMQREGRVRTNRPNFSKYAQRTLSFSWVNKVLKLMKRLK